MMSGISLHTSKLKKHRENDQMLKRVKIINRKCKPITFLIVAHIMVILKKLISWKIDGKWFQADIRWENHDVDENRPKICVYMDGWRKGDGFLLMEHFEPVCKHRL